MYACLAFFKNSIAALNVVVSARLFNVMPAVTVLTRNWWVVSDLYFIAFINVCLFGFLQKFDCSIKCCSVSKTIQCNASCNSSYTKLVGCFRSVLHSLYQCMLVWLSSKIRLQH